MSARRRLKWSKLPPSMTDRVLSTNGAYRAPTLYGLIDIDNGLQVATVRQVVPGWHWSHVLIGEGKALTIEAAKEAAKRDYRSKSHKRKEETP